MCQLIRNFGGGTFSTATIFRKWGDQSLSTGFFIWFFLPFFFVNEKKARQNDAPTGDL